MLWFILALLSAFFAGITIIASKLAIEHIDPIVANFLRAAIFFAILIPVTFIARKIPDIISTQPKTWLWLALAAIAGAASWGFYF